MALYAGLRLLKWAALAALTLGVGRVAAGAGRAERAVAAWQVVVPAIVATFVFGHGLLVVTGRTMAAPFVVVALVAGLGVLHSALWLARREGPGPWARRVPSLLLGVVAGAMVARDAAPELALGAALLGAGLGLALTPPAEIGPDVAAKPAVGMATLRWLARAEGLSLVLLMAVQMPLRHLTGVTLDGGTGALGWAHGTLFLVYVAAVASMARLAGWDRTLVVSSMVASLIPTGTWWVERRWPAA